MAKSSLVWSLSIYEHAISNQGQAEFGLIPKMWTETCHSKAFYVPGTGIMVIWFGGTLSWLLHFFGACTQYSCLSEDWWNWYLRTKQW